MGVGNGVYFFCGKIVACAWNEHDNGPIDTARGRRPGLSNGDASGGVLSWLYGSAEHVTEVLRLIIAYSFEHSCCETKDSGGNLVGP